MELLEYLDQKEKDRIRDLVFSNIAESVELACCVANSMRLSKRELIFMFFSTPDVQATINNHSNLSFNVGRFDITTRVIFSGRPEQAYYKKRKKSLFKSKLGDCYTLTLYVHNRKLSTCLFEVPKIANRYELRTVLLHTFSMLYEEIIYFDTELPF